MLKLQWTMELINRYQSCCFVDINRLIIFIFLRLRNIAAVGSIILYFALIVFGRARASDFSDRGDLDANGAGSLGPVQITWFTKTISPGGVKGRISSTKSIDVQSSRLDPTIQNVCISLDFPSLFGTAEYRLEERWWGEFSRIASLINVNRNARLEFYSSGHSDSILSRRRLSFLRGFLIERGVNPMRIPADAITRDSQHYKMCPH